MTKIKVFIFPILIFFILFGSCKKNQEVKEINKFVNSWKATKKPIPFSGILKIKKNQTFEYFAGACTSTSFSNGKWEIRNDTIILNSFMPNKCCLIWEFEYNCDKILKKGEPFSFRKTIKDCEPTLEEDYIEFDNVQFYLKDTILVHKRKFKNNCPKEIGEFNNNFTIFKNTEK